MLWSPRSSSPPAPEITPVKLTAAPLLEMTSVPAESAMSEVIVRTDESVSFAVSPAPGAPVDGDQLAASFQFPAAPFPVHVYSAASQHSASDARRQAACRAITARIGLSNITVRLVLHCFMDFSFPSQSLKPLWMNP